ASRRRAGRRRALWLAGAAAGIVLFAFTRQAALIPAGALGLAFVGEWVKTRRWRNSWLAPAATIVGASAACQLYQAVRYPFDQAAQLMEQTGTATLGQALARAPRRLWAVVKWAFGAFAQDDQIMIVFGALAAVGLVVCWNRVEAHLALGAVLGGMVYQAANGTMQTGLRYCEPGFFAYALLVGAALAALGAACGRLAAWGGRRLPAQTGAAARREPTAQVLPPPAVGGEPPLRPQTP
ncbi:MAG: hypothetical protein LBD51_08065, partial [Bifidobacteriaceae bacterium]|nr:hypothetical protein [Bifidobacteriaceae bacterium]